MDLTATIAPKSDQINADDLIAGPITVTIENVSKGNAEQPVNIHLLERPGRAYRPSKSMRRVLVAAWGADSSVYAGRKLTLYRNPDITFGREKVGGIEISHLSHIDREMQIPLTVKRGQRRPHAVAPMSQSSAPVYWIPDLGSVDAYRDHYKRRQAEGADPQELAEIASVAKTVEAQQAPEYPVEEPPAE